MSVRTEIQKRVIALIQSGTFEKVTYDANHQPVMSGENKTPKSVLCNEVSGGISGSASRGAFNQGYVLTNWRFEAYAQFDCEVDTSYFMLKELTGLNFSLDDLLIKVVPSGDFKATHPPQDASHNGTKLNIGLTATTRR